MPRVFICTTEDGPNLVREVRPDCLISTTCDASEVPTLNYPGYNGVHYVFRTEEVLAPPPYQLRPPSYYMAMFIGWISPYCGADATIVYACSDNFRIGLALAYITMCYANPDVSETVLITRLKAAYLDMQPNMQLVSIGDTLLKRDGRMVEAVERTNDVASSHDHGL